MAEAETFFGHFGNAACRMVSRPIPLAILLYAFGQVEMALAINAIYNTEYNKQVTLNYNSIMSTAVQNKKLSYRRGTARCVVSVKYCQLPCNSAETTCTTSPEQIKVMKLEGYSGTLCNKHVHSTVTRSSRFHCPIGAINKPTTDRVR